MWRADFLAFSSGRRSFVACFLRPDAVLRVLGRALTRGAAGNLKRSSAPLVSARCTIVFKRLR
eukprot:9934653-Heterocapsa_arctica.AAC.1